jgi:hypothetical protein
MPVYTVLLVFAVVRTGLALVAYGRAVPGGRPWPAPVQGAAEICCALLLRTYFDPPFRGVLGAAIYPMFAFALLWSVIVWARRIWALTGGVDDVESPSILGAFGLGVESGAVQIARVLWHVGFVAPSLVCGAFVLFGLAGELPPH